MTSLRNTYRIEVLVGLDLKEVLDAYCARANVSRPSMIRWILWAFLRSPVADEALTLWNLMEENEEKLLDELIEENNCTEAA